MSVGTEAEQRAYLRRAVGHAEDTALISNDLLDDCLTHALREVNLTWPDVGVASFDTVANQQVYDVLPVGAYNVRKVFWPQSCQHVFPFQLASELELLFSYNEVLEGGNSIRYTLEPAAVLGVLRFKEYLHRWFEGSAKVEKPGRVYLDPVPSDAGDKVYFTYSSPRYAIVDDVADVHGPAYFSYAKKSLHEALAAGRGALQSISSPAGVSMVTGARDSHLILADREGQRWLDLVPTLTPTRSWP